MEKEPTGPATGCLGLFLPPLSDQLPPIFLGGQTATHGSELLSLKGTIQRSIVLNFGLDSL
jgi:hypothetical protein